MGEHAPLPASGKWGYCSGSLQAEAPFADLETDATREGAATHWVIEQTLLAFQGRVDGPLICWEYIGTTAGNGVVIDADMAVGAQTHVDDVLKVAQKYGGVQGLKIEHRVFMPKVHPDNWGTLDTGLYVPAAKRLYLWDYKNGHSNVDVVGNLQAVDYIEGLHNEFDFPTDTEIVIRIVQPFSYSRAGPVKEWRTSYVELVPYLEKLRVHAYEAAAGNAPLTVGAHCRFCLARGTCPALRESTYRTTDVIRMPYAMDDMTGADLATERGILKRGLSLGKARLETLEVELEHRVKNGDTSSGLVLEAVQGRRNWTVPVDTAVAFSAMFGVDVSKPGALTPTQAKAKAPAKIRGNYQSAIKAISRRSSSVTLVDASDTIGARAFKMRKD